MADEGDAGLLRTRVFTKPFVAFLAESTHKDCIHILFLNIHTQKNMFIKNRKDDSERNRSIDRSQ